MLPHFNIYVDASVRNKWQKIHLNQIKTGSVIKDLYASHFVTLKALHGSLNTNQKTYELGFWYKDRCLS